MRVNDEIEAKSVRCIGPDGKQIGVISKAEALRLADEAGLDLVEISPTAVPPVCKIMDFGKFKYELAKKEKDSRKKQHVIVTKEIRLRPKTEEHDFLFKVKHARKFIEEGNRVKATVMFRGRENAHREFGEAVLERLKKELEDVAKVEKDTKFEGGQLILYLTKK
ncbi:MAG: translation initiation factor IF-3 [candidate division KSB1 bacterium]|nr:translation initiation factor IF-3 [candidate division KSB1 bacterium]MDZ7346462.1 translation initiation factor IF-3 [candidate division KSB1 bacterium]